jgi:hypothetical protein
VSAKNKMRTLLFESRDGGCIAIDVIINLDSLHRII